MPPDRVYRRKLGLRHRVALLGALALAATAFLPDSASPQGATFPVPISINELNFTKRYLLWPISGRVMTLKGDPIAGADVRIDVGAGQERSKVIQSNLQGEFVTEVKLEETLRKIKVDVVASKPGFLDARETEEFESEEAIRGFNLVLRDEAVNAEMLTQAALVAALAPRFSARGAGPALAEARREYERGVELFLNKHNAPGALAPLQRAVAADPGCTECQALLGLADIETGSWASARHRLGDAAEVITSGKATSKRPEVFLILGVMEAWRSDPKASLGFLLKAQEVQPEDPLVLQEIGRALILLQNWEAADQYLEKGIKAGAPAEAHLLRLRALLELNETSEAEAELNSFLGGRQPKSMPAPVRILYARLHERLQLQALRSARSTVNQPLPELIQAMPELADVTPVANQEELPRLLQRVGEKVEAFFKLLPNTSSREEIREEILRRDGNPQASLDEKFLYLLLAHPEDLGLGLNEFRTGDDQIGAKAKGINVGFMRTSGFACTSLHFHPRYQAGASFRLLGRQTLEGRPAFVVAFAQDPETAQRIGRFDVDGKSSPVLIQGIAWIDGNNFQIVRMRTDLLKSPPNTRLKRQTTEIEFDEVTFKGLPTPLWLPKEVMVTVEWKGKTFRNLHRYSDFRVFKVDAEEKRKPA